MFLYVDTYFGPKRKFQHIWRLVEQPSSRPDMPLFTYSKDEWLTR